MLTITSHGTTTVWNAGTGQFVASIAPDQIIRRADFSPDGRRVLASTGASASVWDATTGRPLTLTMFHKTSSLHAAFSPDGRYVVTSGLREMSLNGVQVWDAATGHPITPLLSLPNGYHATISRDGRHLLTTGRMAAQLWNLGPDPSSIEDLQRMAHVISGHEIDVTAALVPSKPEAIYDAWKIIQPKYAQDAKPLARAALRWHRYVFPHAYEKEDWFAAAWHFKRLVAAKPAHWKLHAQCGYALANMGLWKDAAAEYAQATALGSDDVTDWSQAAMTRLKCGDVPEYRAACEKMLKQFGETEDPHTLAEVIRAGVLAPDAVRGLEKLADRLDHLGVSDEDKPLGATLAGGALFRGLEELSATHDL